MWARKGKKKILRSGLLEMKVMPRKKTATQLNREIAEALAVGAPQVEQTMLWHRDDLPPGVPKPIKYTWKWVPPFIAAADAPKYLDQLRREHPGIVFIASPRKPRDKK